MTPKEKAEELVEKYANIDNNCNNFAYDKACAIIAVDEIFSVMNSLFTESYLDSLDENKYWQQVKQEIANL